jgi:hypothetical protein
MTEDELNYHYFRFVNKNLRTRLKIAAFFSVHTRVLTDLIYQLLISFYCKVQRQYAVLFICKGVFLKTFRSFIDGINNLRQFLLQDRREIIL